MYWLRLLWAVVRGIAWGVSDAKWDEFVAERTGRKQGPGPQSGAPASGPFTGPVTPSEPAAGVRVETARKEGEFTGGLPYMGGSADPRVRPSQAAAAPRDGESRRKRRTRPQGPGLAEQVCARCKDAMQHDLTPPPTEGLAVVQEADLDEPAPTSVEIEAPAAGAAAPVGDPEGNEGPLGTEGESDTAESPAESDVSRPALADRLVTRLGTRAALARLSEARASLSNQAMGG